MIHPHVTVNLSLSEKDEKGDYTRNFYELTLERSTISYLPTVWTVVHEIDPKSPLYKYDTEEITQLHGEVMVLIKYYDEAFNQELYQLHSYTFKELLMN